jgi:hypothetical protein
MRCDGCGKTVTHVRFAARGPWTGKYVCRECWTAPRLVDVRFGLEVEWKDFERRYPRFLDVQSQTASVLVEVVPEKVSAAGKTGRAPLNFRINPDTTVSSLDFNSQRVATQFRVAQTVGSSDSFTAPHS